MAQGSERQRQRQSTPARLRAYGGATQNKPTVRCTTDRLGQIDLCRAPMGLPILMTSEKGGGVHVSVSVSKSKRYLGSPQFLRFSSRCRKPKGGALFFSLFLVSLHILLEPSSCYFPTSPDSWPDGGISHPSSLISVWPCTTLLLLLKSTSLLGLLSYLPDAVASTAYTCLIFRMSALPISYYNGAHTHIRH